MTGIVYTIPSEVISDSNVRTFRAKKSFCSN